MKNKLILPIAEFITTAHDSVSITKYLFSIKKIFENSMNPNKRFIVPPLIVTDFSWALITAILEAFNNCSVINYLNWTFDVILKYSENIKLNQLMKTRIIICQTHIFKAVVQKTNVIIEKRRISEKNYDDKNTIKKLFLFCFTILQNSTHLDEFNEALRDIFRIFCLENNTDETSFCIKRIEEQILKRNFNLFKIIDVELLSKITIDKSNLDIHINKENCHSIKQNSPFNKYFNSIIHSMTMDDSKKVENTGLNQYFAPELFNIIKDKLYLIPLWTGLMIRQCQRVQVHTEFVSNDCNIFNLTRITNNPVENRMEYLKNKLLMKRTRLVTSELVRPIYNDIKSKYFEYYYDDDLNQRNFDGFKSTKQINEKWMDKNLKNLKREKSYYYKNLINAKNSDLSNLIIYFNFSFYAQKIF